MNQVIGQSRSLVNWVIRVGIALHDYSAGETRYGFIDTRIIKAKPLCRFAASNSFKPGMPFEGHVYVLYDDNQPLPVEKLETATLLLKPIISGSTRNAVPAEIRIPSKSAATDTHQDYTTWMERQAQEEDYQQFRSVGIYHFRMVMPPDAVSMKITAQYRDDDGDETTAVLQTVAFYSTDAASSSFYAHISTSTKPMAMIGQNAIFHLRANFPFSSYNYVVSFH